MKNRLLVYTADWISQKASQSIEKIRSMATVVNVDKEPHLVGSLKLSTLPTVRLLSYQDGSILQEFKGLISPKEVHSIINRLSQPTSRSPVRENFEISQVNTSLNKSVTSLKQPALKGAVKMFLAGRREVAIEKVLQLYKREFESTGFDVIYKMPEWQATLRRPARQTLILMLQTLGPFDPITVMAKAKLRILINSEKLTPIKPRYLRARKGGLPRRLLNGKWLWEGPHWSVFNKNRRRSGYSSNDFDRIVSE